MASKRKFFKQIIQVEVLSEDVPLEWDNLADVHDAITTGTCSGKVTEQSKETVDGPTMAKLLEAQASDPAFFNLTENGEDADE